MSDQLNTAIKKINFSAIDFESAGTATGMTDAPVQIGIATWSSSSETTETWESYIQTDKDITWAAQKVHGITKQDIKNAPKLSLLWPEVKSRLSATAVIAHGHGTEKRFLRAYAGHQFGPWIDTLTLSRKLWPDLPSHQLATVCKHLQIVEAINKLVPKKTWHDALYDATASLLIVQHIILTYQLDDKPLFTLTNQ